MAKGEVCGVNEEEGAIIVPAWPPNDVTMPPELGGGTVDVTEYGHMTCPIQQCKQDHPSLILANGMFVVHCPEFGFLWLRKPKDTGPETNHKVL